MFTLSQGSAITLVLLTTFLWGSWFQAIKHLGDYPVSAFMLWLYTFSCAIVWVVIAVAKPMFIGGGIVETVMASKELALLVVICGALFAVGMQIQMFVVKKIGLILSTSVSATCSILFGTIISALVGGLPEKVSMGLIMLAAVILVCATIVCQFAGKLRNSDVSSTVSASSSQQGKKKNYSILFLLVFSNAFLLTAYPLALSMGIQSDMNPSGFPSILCIGLLAIGSFLGTLIYSGIALTRSKSWRMFLHPKRKICILMALISASCHYGGNIIHTIAAPILSMAIAWPMGNSFHMWSYIWGIGYGEFRGASKRTYMVLIGGMSLFVVGVLLLSLSIYR